MKIYTFLLITFFVIAANLSFANEGMFSGYMMGDYYWIISNHDSDLEGKNGFWFRRIYFTYDQNLNEAFAVRLRFEMASDGKFGTEAIKHTPYIKDALLKWKYTKNHQMIIGISPTPTWSVLEKFWGYRSVEKTLLDIQKWSSSRDFGLALQGSLLADDQLKYHFMLANGSGENSEINDGKKAFGAISYHFSKSFFIQIYADRNDNVNNKTYSGWTTLQGFAGFQNGGFRLGLQTARQYRTLYNGDELTLDAASVFSIYDISDQVKLFARVDRMFDANPEGHKINYLPFDNSANSTLYIAGIDYSPANGVYFIPNVEMITYGENSVGFTPNTDLVPRVTFFYVFKESR